MKRKIGRIVTLFLLITMLVPVQVHADGRTSTRVTETLSDQTTSTANLSFSISGKKMTAFCTVQGSRDTYRIYTAITLQKYSGGVWKRVKRWEKCQNTRTLSLARKRRVKPGLYRLKCKYAVRTATGRDTRVFYSRSLRR